MGLKSPHDAARFEQQKTGLIVWKHRCDYGPSVCQFKHRKLP